MDVLQCIWKVFQYVLKCKNVFLMVDRCILKDTKVFRCFSMHLSVFIEYFVVLVVYFNVIQCIYSVFQCTVEAI
jgi:hypothetical protein